MTTTSNLETLHFDHRLWANELSFFADELGIFEHRLEELSVKAGAEGTRSQLEQFQNQFIRQREVLDELQHNIKVHEQKLGQALQKQEELPLDPDFHNYMEEQMATYRALYAELKQKFYAFLSAHR